MYFEVKESQSGAYTYHRFLHKLEAVLMVADNHEAKVHEPLAANFFGLYGSTILCLFQDIKNYYQP